MIVCFCSDALDAHLFGCRLPGMSRVFVFEGIDLPVVFLSKSPEFVDL